MVGGHRAEDLCVAEAGTTRTAAKVENRPGRVHVVPVRAFSEGVCGDEGFVERCPRIVLFVDDEPPPALGDVEEERAVSFARRLHREDQIGVREYIEGDAGEERSSLGVERRARIAGKVVSVTGTRSTDDRVAVGIVRGRQLGFGVIDSLPERRQQLRRARGALLELSRAQNLSVLCAN